MVEDSNSTEDRFRSNLAYKILIFSVVAITVLGITAILVKKEDAITILNIILPVIATWVGTILAFYFGKVNFESASKQVESTNKQVRELVSRLTPEEKASSPVSSIMRMLADIVLFEIPIGKGDKDITIKNLTTKLGGRFSRLTIIDANKKAKYMIHESSIDRYINSGGNENDSLELFISKQKHKKKEYDLNSGFVIVSKNTSISKAKYIMENAQSCQDIFITNKGKSDEPLIGWISNIRLIKYLEP